MPEELVLSLTLFYCYAHEDQQFLEEIDLHLTNLKNQCHIDSYFGGECFSNTKQEEKSLRRLKGADLVVLLISTHFSVTDYFGESEDREMKWRQWLGQQRIISMLLEPVDGKNIPLVSQDILPNDARPLKEWENQEQAFQNIEEGMYAAVEKLWLTRGDMLLQEMGNPEEALKAYAEALRLNPSTKLAWFGKGNAFVDLDVPRYEEALIAYDEVLRLDPTFSRAWYTKGGALAGLQRYEEALIAYEEALRLDPSNMHIWYWKGEVLKALKKRKEARQAQRKAHQLGWPL